jgi:hypothetical protein
MATTIRLTPPTKINIFKIHVPSITGIETSSEAIAKKDSMTPVISIIYFFMAVRGYNKKILFIGVQK